MIKNICILFELNKKKCKPQSATKDEQNINMLICSFQHNNQQQSVFTSYSFRSVSFILQTIRFSLISLYIFFVVNFVNIIYFLKIPIWFDFNSVVICFIFLVVDMTHQSIMIVVILVIELFFFYFHSF